MHQRICSNKEARSLKIRPRGSLQITANTLLRVQALPARFPPKTRYKRATRRVTSVQQDALRVCNNTRYERAIDAPRACNTTRYMRAIDTLLCATTHNSEGMTVTSEPPMLSSHRPLRPSLLHGDVAKSSQCLSILRRHDRDL